MKKSLNVLLSMALLTSLVLMLSGCGKDDVVQIGITQIVEHPSLDAAQQGFIAALKDAGYEEGKDIEFDIQYAQGDATNNMSIAQKFAADKKDLILAVSTGSAQAAAQATSDIPVLFTAVTDPLGANLVSDLENPTSNVTGTSDTHPEEIAKLMNFIASEFPNIKTVGIVANEGEQNSLVSVERAQAALEPLGLEVVRASASNGSEVKQAAESLVGRADAIYVPKDNTVVAALEAVIQVAEENDMPLFVGEKDSVERGGFASFGFEYYDLGYTTGKMAVEILKNGKTPGDIPVGYPEELDLAINMKAAANMEVEVTDAMLGLIIDKEKHLFE
jgi:putative ABC transport system substrate-binding protein